MGHSYEINGIIFENFYNSQDTLMDNLVRSRFESGQGKSHTRYVLNKIRFISDEFSTKYYYIYMNK